MKITDLFIAGGSNITRIKGCLVILSISVLCCMDSAHAVVDPIPEESGFSGRLNVGGGWMQVKSNTIAGNSAFDFGNDIIDSLNASADSQSSALGLFNGEVEYTFGESRTQLFFGN